MNTLRGPAHSIHSNVHIVLPAPLAPELYPDDRISVFAGGSVSRASSFYGPQAAGGEGDRKSAADPWLSGALAQSRTSVALKADTDKDHQRERSPTRSASSARVSNGTSTLSSRPRRASI
ncbi:hypothetical protein BN946_scf184977.g118 [Trametes cinnabarina]|uniref:Uncharacterized protein n=1 Tax=Pycnoporus cinnabarinus TaxID=5643 RepID=A0A060SJM8_PYCCI|nr:hypothetical protein BN946_scf184977.g118 [Trametes cinnabarina]